MAFYILIGVCVFVSIALKAISWDQAMEDENKPVRARGNLLSGNVRITLSRLPSMITGSLTRNVKIVKVDGCGDHNGRPLFWIHAYDAETKKEITFTAMLCNMGVVDTETGARFQFMEEYLEAWLEQNQSNR